MELLGRKCILMLLFDDAMEAGTVLRLQSEDDVDAQLIQHIDSSGASPCKV
jgi:hypothetical protein